MGVYFGFLVAMVELLVQYKADTRIRNFFGTSPHDAMFEMEDIPAKIKSSIFGRENQRGKKKAGPVSVIPDKRLKTTAVLKKISESDLKLK